MSLITASLGARTQDFVSDSYYDASGNPVALVRDDIFATISGSTFRGAVNFNAGLSGSLTRLTDGKSFIEAGTGIAVASSSAGITISNTGPTSGNTLDQSYDQGGAGAGAIVTVDKQAVQLRTTAESTFALVLTGAIAVGSGSAFQSEGAPRTGYGTDVLCWLSGNAGSQGSSITRGTVLVSGDLACSGTFIYPSASVGYINIPAAGFFNAGSMQFTPNYGNTGTATSYFANPATVQGSLQAAIYGLPPGCTIDQIELHQSRSATQAGQLALFRFQNNISTNNHEHIASKTYTQKGEVVLTTLDNLSHSVAAESTANQFSYHIVVISGQGVSPPGAAHRTYGAKVRFTYSKLRL